jgi:uncharacterized membrane protein YfcA
MNRAPSQPAPEPYPAFDRAMRALVKVPKSAVDAARRKELKGEGEAEGEVMEPRPVIDYQPPREGVKERRGRHAKDTGTALFGGIFYGVLSIIFWMSFLASLASLGPDPSVAVIAVSLATMTTCASAYCWHVWHQGKSG